MRYFKGLVPIGKRVAVSPLFLVLAAASVLGGYADMFFIAYASALVHELAHIAAANRLKVEISRIEIHPFGICGKLGAGFIKSPVKEILIAGAGPLCSGVAALILFWASRKLGGGQLVSYGIRINLSLMIINLLPALPLDGGRIAKGALSLAVGGIRAYNLMIKFSKIPIAAILGFSVYLLLTSDFNLSLILIGVFLLGNLTLEQRNISIISLREILYYKDRLERTEFCPVVRLAAHSSLRANLFVRKLGCHKYHIVDVIDDRGRIIKTVTESQIISALINRSIRLTMGEI